MAFILTPKYLQIGKIAIIKNMLAKNYPISDISDLTGLSPPDIEKLKDSLD